MKVPLALAAILSALDAPGGASFAPPRPAAASIPRAGAPPGGQSSTPVAFPPSARRIIRSPPRPATLAAPLAARSLLPPLTSSSALKALIAFVVLALATKFRERIFYPGSSPDPSKSEPLPPGTIGGCPWIGSLGLFSGMNEFLINRAASIEAKSGAASDGGGAGPLKIWKMFILGTPTAVVSGSAGIKKVLGREFKKEGGGVSQITELGNSDMVKVLFGEESLSFETSNPQKYHMLQKLVGQAMTPEAVARGIPFLQKCSEEAVYDMLSSETAVMADLFRKFTLDVAWRQIIGLKLKGDEEISAFRAAVRTWFKALENYFLIMAPIPRWLMRRLPAFKAKAYLNERIGERIDQLQRDGPDGTTMSAMVYATGEDDGARLTRQQVVDNTFLLLLAGSETSSLTLTNVMLLLGMHPEAWEKLVNEQRDFVEKHGEAITKDDLDNDCPYLDGVLRETMRLLPISAGGARKVDDTVVMDGVQIPKGWFALYSPALTHAQDPKTIREDGSHMDIEAGFQPERWMDAATRPTTEYMPFGAGHRFCLGHTLATAEMKTFLAVLARKVKDFDLLTKTKNMKWKEGVIITPRDGVVVAAH
ncbi:hypothetical protein ACHAWF_011584 [Thalassiosira exigua]